MNIVPCTQGGGVWLQNHVGRVTASRINDVMNFLKGGEPGADRKKYMAEKIAETLTGEIYQDGYVSKDMLRGIELEAEARSEYELHEGLLVDQVGFVLHPTIERAGASPDGILGASGGLELKVPKTETHLKWILGGTVPIEHRNQMLFGMACTGAEWWDFATYDPRLPEKLRLMVCRLHRDEEQIVTIENHVVQFLHELDQTIAKLQEMVGPFPVGKVEDRPAEPRSAEDGWLTDEDFEAAIRGEI